MFVKIKCETNYCGEWDETVREFPDDTTDDQLDDYAAMAADENALQFGELEYNDNDRDDDDDAYREAYGSWEKLTGTREEIEEDYGDILKP